MQRKTGEAEIGQLPVGERAELGEDGAIGAPAGEMGAERGYGHVGLLRLLQPQGKARVRVRRWAGVMLHRSIARIFCIAA